MVRYSPFTEKKNISIQKYSPYKYTENIATKKGASTETPVISFYTAMRSHRNSRPHHIVVERRRVIC